MSSTKKISINPEFFKLTNISSKKKGEKKDKEKVSSELIKPNLKRELIHQVNQHRKNIQKEKVKKETKKDVKEIGNNIDQSLEYLNNLAKKHVEKKRKKREKKRERTMKNTEYTEQKEQPPYSNLKNSDKPSYSQWRKTLKNNEDIQINNKSKISFGKGDEIITDVKIFEDSFDERQKKMTDLKLSFITQEEPTKKKKVKRTHKTIRRKITLGKHKNRVGVLIKNRKTRKNIEKEMNTLRKKSMNQVKKYLRKHNLIKIGCAAPDSMLRDMFTDIYSSGDIYNKNPDILLHNYVEAK